MRRYGRATHKASLDLIDRKHLARGQAQLAELRKQLQEATAALDATAKAGQSQGTAASGGRQRDKGKQAPLTPAQMRDQVRPPEIQYNCV